MGVAVAVLPAVALTVSVLPALSRFFVFGAEGKIINNNESK